MPAVTPAGGGGQHLVPRGRPPELIDEGEDPFADLTDDVGQPWPLVDYSHIVPAPAPWEELTSTEAGVLLRHDGQLYVAVLVDVDTVISTTLGGHTE